MDPTTIRALPDDAAIRARFPGLAGPDVLLDNAGGSQVPREVADAIRDYLLHDYVQLGADYATSRRATALVQRAHAFVETLVNARDRGRVALGPSTSAACAMLAQAYARTLDPRRNEIVFCDAGHEANLGPWARLADDGWTLRTWRVDPREQTCALEALEALLSERTRLVAIHHVSNLLGRVEDLAGVVERAHAVGARVVADGVAYAPHRAIDVAAWDVDWYVYSTYKVFGPHMAALYGKHEAFAELEGPNHYFVPREEVPYKWELGGVCHESCAGLLALGGYLRFLAGAGPGDGHLESCDRATVEAAFELMSARERPLQARLLEYLNGRGDVRLIGPTGAGDERVATVSFVHASRSSREIVEAVNERGLGVRYGHFYAHRLCLALGLEPDDGVVRTSLVHYNTLDEVERLVAAFDEVL